VRQPSGRLSIRTVAMPADTNPHGDIFGGWLLSQMDIAGGVTAFQRARGRVVTVALDAMTFHTPVSVGDIVCCYADIKRVGTSSITIGVEAWAITGAEGSRRLVTEGTFTYVAIGPDKRPRPVPPE
jgi:acyl-CoA thioesterase YciA